MLSTVAPPCRTLTGNRRRGMALIMVFVVLLALFLVGVPFLRSMSQYRAAVDTSQHNQIVRQDAASIQDLFEAAYSANAHTLDQQLNAASGVTRASTQYGIPPWNDPDITTKEEFAFRFLLESLVTVEGEDGEFAPALSVRSARGHLWDLDVEDEQAKVNLDTATPFLIGNLLGASELLVPMEDGDQGTTSIVCRRPPMWRVLGHRPDLLEQPGFVWIDGELLHYRTVNNAPNQCVLGGVTRALQSDRSLGQYRFLGPDDGLAHPLGSAVVPLLAYKLASYRSDPFLQQVAQGTLPAVDDSGSPAFSEIAPSWPPPATPLFWFKDIPDIRSVGLYTLASGVGDANSAMFGVHEAVMPDVYDSIRRLVTVASTSPSGLNFVNSHVLTNELPRGTGTVQTADVDQNRGINPGSFIRIRGQNGVTDYAMVSAVNGNTLTLDRFLQRESAQAPRFEQRAALIDVMPRTPININTASLHVLTAVFQGLRVQGDEVVTFEDAFEVASAVLARVHDPQQPQPFIDHEDFRDFISMYYTDWGLTGEDRTAIILNATQNQHPALLTPTAPFCYRSFDTFTVRSTAVYNEQPLFAGPGAPLARMTQERLLTVGAPAGLRGVWPQWELTDILESRQQGRGGTGLTMQTRVGPEGVIALRSELPLRPDAPQGGGQMRNYLYRDFPGLGQNFMAGQPFELPVPMLGERAGSRMNLQAGYLNMWVKLQDLDSNPQLLVWDFSEQDLRNRLCVMYDRDRDALVLRMAGPELDAAFTDLVYPNRGAQGLSLRSGVWYHLMAAWKGSSFDDRMQNETNANWNPIAPRLNLMIDGMPVTPVNREPSRWVHTYYPNNDLSNQPVEIGTVLVRDLPPAPNGGIVDPGSPWHRVEVRDAANLPAQGVIKIGEEAIAYSLKQGNVLTGQLVDITDPLTNLPTGQQRVSGFGRAARGTNQNYHRAGARVQLFGYSVFLEQHDEADYLPACEGYSQQQCGTQTGPQTGVGTIKNEDTVSSEYPSFPTWGPQAGLIEGGRELRCESGTIEDFPDRGYLLIRGGAIERYEKDDDEQWVCYLYGGATIDSPNPVPAGNIETCVEIVYYNGKISGTAGNEPYDAFLIQTRNAMVPANLGGGWLTPPTTDGFHWPNSPDHVSIALISWQADNTNGYLPHGFVQLSDSNEIIRYTQLHASPEPYFLFNDAQMNGINAWRGQMGTTLTDHSSTGQSVKMLPVWRVRGRSWQRTPLGRGDDVTLVSGRNNRPVNKWVTIPTRQLRINWTRRDGQIHQWVTLDDFVANDYRPGSGTRVLKFPSEEMPVELPTALTVGGPTNGGGTGGSSAGTIDELELQGQGSGNYRLRGGGCNDNQTRIEVNNVSQGMNRNVGCIRVDDELIAYRGITREDTDGDGQNEYYLENCIRGFLGTYPAAHVGNELYINLSSLRMVLLSTVLNTQQGSQFRIDGENGQMPFDDVGFALVAGNDPFDLEIVGFTRPNRRSRDFTISDFAYNDQGLFRGRFGTSVQNHGQNAILVNLPYRYIDRYCDPSRVFHDPNSQTPYTGPLTIDSPEQYLVGGGTAEPGAGWIGVHWQIEDHPLFSDVEGDHVEIQLLIKPSSVPDWHDPSVRRFIFRHNEDVVDAGIDEQADQIGVTPILQQYNDLRNGQGDPLWADGIDWRVAFVFTDNAFRWDSWKWTPAFFGLWFDYEQQGRTYRTQWLGR